MSLMLHGAAIAVPAPAGGTAVTPKELFDKLFTNFVSLANLVAKRGGFASLEWPLNNW